MSTEEIKEEVKQSLLRQKAQMAKYGVDLSKFWKDLQKTIKTKNKKDE